MDMLNSDNTPSTAISTSISLLSNPAIIIIIALCCIGILLFVVGTWFGQSSPKSSVSTDTLYSTAAAGYIIATVSIICMIIYMFIKAPASNTIFKTFFNILPAVITQIVLIFAAVQILIFKPKLVNHSIADTYYKNNMNFTILLLFQLILLWFFFFLPKQINLKYFLYVLGIINLLLLGMNQCILQFYSTDG